jgi:hypothetical protein
VRRERVGVKGVFDEMMRRVEGAHGLGGGKDGQVLYATTAGVESVDVAIDSMLDYQH